MKIFFESVVDEVIDNLVLEKTYFIIPNQRSKAFLKREILKKISSILQIPEKIISIKATSNEKIGFIGDGLGIAAESIVQISNENIY